MIAVCVDLRKQVKSHETPAVLFYFDAFVIDNESARTGNKRFALELTHQ